jgi:hypothetical protein
MFKSKTRPILYTQYEHGRLAGTLAALWGNKAFDRPALDFDAFVAGVTLHDWGYRVLDNVPIGESTEEAWLEVVRRGIDYRFAHPTTDIVVKLHIRRLLSWDSSPEREALIEAIDDQVNGRLPESGATLEAFQRADKITQLCDMISFDYCFEAPQERTYQVYKKPNAAETTRVSYRVQAGGEVVVDPWPFGVPAITGTILAFTRKNYPDELNPLVVGYTIRPV